MIHSFGKHRILHPKSRTERQNRRDRNCHAGFKSF